MKYKRLVTLFSAALVAGAISAPAFAHMPYGNDANAEVSQEQMRAMDHYMDTHPADAAALRANPSLVNDERFVDNHLTLRNFLDNHSDLRQSMSEHPGRFMHMENHYQRSARDDQGTDTYSSGSSSAKWNEFLDHNQNFAQRYRENPSIINDRDTMNHEPGLREFLANHPDVKAHLYGHRYDYNGRGENSARAYGGDSALNNQYLEAHPNLAKALRNNPSLINDPNFINSHPNLRAYLRDHPGARN